MSHVVSYHWLFESLRPCVSCGVVPLALSHVRPCVSCGVVLLALSHVRPLQLTLIIGIIGNQGEDYEV